MSPEQKRPNYFLAVASHVIRARNGNEPALSLKARMVALVIASSMWKEPWWSLSVPTIAAVCCVGDRGTSEPGILRD
jgi:hypothetical protein